MKQTHVGQEQQQLDSIPMATAYKPAAMKTVPPDAALLPDCASVSEKPVFETDSVCQVSSLGLSAGWC